MNDSSVIDPLTEALERCALGEEKALERLYRLAAPKLFGQVLRIVKREDWAEDILQEGFVRIWQHAAEYDRARSKASTWMGRILRNASLDQLRRRKRESGDVSLDEHDLPLPDLNSDPLLAVARGSDISQLQSCLDELGEDPRRCILMAYYQGYTHDEMSGLLDRPLGTIKSWIRRGLERLRQCLEP